jgi:hypothetical protein
MSSLRFISHMSLFCFLFFAPVLHAGGPTYSRYGLGDLMYFGSNRTDAMGGASIGLLGDGFINRLNPAGLAKISFTRISGSFEYQNFSSTDGQSSGTFARGQFNGLALAIPISTPHGIVLSADASPYSTVNYATKVVDNLSTFRSTQTFYGSGGLNSFNLALSYQPTPWLSLGAKFNYLFGATRQLTKVDFKPPLTDSDIHTNWFFSGQGVTIGAIYSGFAEHFSSSSLTPLTFGMVLSTPARLKARGERVIYFTRQNYDTSNTSSSSATIPWSVGLGMSYTFSSRYVLAADYFTQNWSGTNFLGSPAVELGRRTRVGMGFESMPERTPTDYFSRLHFRVGFYYHSTYYRLGEAINEFTGTAGVGLPIGPDARLNLGIQYGVRGTTANGLQKDTILRVTASISASEVWFARIEED